MNSLPTHERHLVHIMQLLGDVNRFKIFKVLITNKELCVSEIAELLQITPSAVSQHFKQFELLHLVEKVRKGQKICYRLNSDDTLINDIKKLVKEGK